MSKVITEKRDAELLEILLRSLEERSAGMTVQNYPPCAGCGRQHHTGYEYDFHPDRKGMVVKAALCICGKQIYPYLEFVN